jgi:hypothetical protein
MDDKKEMVIGSRRLSKGILVLAVIFPLLLTGMGRHIKRDLSDDERFSWVLQKEYRTKEDVVIHKLSKRGQTVYLSEFDNSVPSREEIGDKFPYCPVF